MAASTKLSESTVNYKLFSINTDDNSNVDSNEKLEILAEDYLSRISGFLQRYIWQNDCFNLRVIPSMAGVPAHLEGFTNFEDNVEDEWFIVYLLFYLSERYKDLYIQIQDSDGEFLLIEAAEVLPKWVNPSSVENRVYLHQGSIHIIPISCSTTDAVFPSGTLTVSDALPAIRQLSSKTKATIPVQEAIRSRINGYPHKIDEYKHRALCYLPCAVAALLKEDPSLLSPAVKAFYLRDPIDLKACRAMKYFAPETRVMSEVMFTRCLYAQLSSQKYEPDRMVGWNLPPLNTPDRKAHELGMKLACGFEILASNEQKIMQTNEEVEYDFNNDVRWRRFTKSLKIKGYFKDEVEGSQLHNRLFHQAKEFYLSSLKNKTMTNANPGIRVHRLLKTINVNYEDMKEAEKSLKPADDDSWMDITPAILDSMLEDLSQSPKEPEVASAITSSLKSFVQSRSDVDGVEPPMRPPRGKKQKINFDPDAFADAVGAILDFRIPNSDDSDSSSSMSGYSDDDDDDVTLEEGQGKKYNTGNKEGSVLSEMKDYMDCMDRELAKTNVGLSFERQPPRAIVEDDDDYDEEENPLSVNTLDINDESDDFCPVDVNLTALKNILESYSSQQGLPGPASNLLSSMGLQLPDNLDP